MQVRVGDIITRVTPDGAFAGEVESSAVVPPGDTRRFIVRARDTGTRS